MTISTSTLASALVLGCLGLAGQAMAACTGTPMTEAALRAVVNNNTVCAVRGAESWQELHQPGGALIDFKRGPTHPIDPSERVGSWSIGPSGQITYNYGTGGTTTFAVRPNGGASYSFCGVGGAADIDVTIKIGGGAC